MHDDGAFRITTLRTRDLCTRLDCTVDRDALDAALGDAGYVRLDHGLDALEMVSITPTNRAIGLDPGHRGPALELAAAMLHVVRADGRPDEARVRAAVDRALVLSPTDSAGEWIASALAAYCMGREPGTRLLDPDARYAVDVAALASGVYETARNAQVVTDVAIERADAVGVLLPDWRTTLMSNMRPEEPVVRVRRHDAADYERHGIDPPLAELIAWVRSNPQVDVDSFTRYARDVGIEPREAGARVLEALGGVSGLLGSGQDIEKGGPSSTS